MTCIHMYTGWNSSKRKSRQVYGHLSYFTTIVLALLSLTFVSTFWE